MLVPYRDFNEYLPRATAKKDDFLNPEILLIVCFVHKKKMKSQSYDGNISELTPVFNCTNPQIFRSHMLVTVFYDELQYFNILSTLL